MISKEDIKRINNQEEVFDELRKESPKKWWSEKNATHKNTPLDRYNEPMYQKNASHRNTHHTRQGGRTDLSTSSQGLSPSRTDRVMRILRSWCIIIWGWSGIVADKMIKEVKIIKGILWK